MGEKTGIAWCDHTFNPWMGCTKVSPGCEHCYAERDMAIRHKLVTWGPGAPRRRTSEANWAQVLKWNRKAHEALTQRRVFCASLADVFDNEVDDAWRQDLWRLIQRTPNLDWLLLTKRIGNVKEMLPDEIARMSNVWLGITVVNQEEVERDVPKLVATRTHGPRWLSMEPLLECVDLCDTLGMWWNDTMQCFEAKGRRFNPDGIDWVVVGGESGHHARPMQDGWADSLRQQCRAAGVPFFFKQQSQANAPGTFKDFDSFPKHLKVREFPR